MKSSLSEEKLYCTGLQCHISGEVLGGGGGGGGGIYGTISIDVHVSSKHRVIYGTACYWLSY